MSTKLFVGNLPFSCAEEQLEEMFNALGKVVSVAIPRDRETGRKRGFAFVEMEDAAEAEQAIQRFNGSHLEGREIVVNVAKEREGRPGGGGGRPNFRQR
jgi:RNA recognition motif-containing protein